MYSSKLKLIDRGELTKQAGHITASSSEKTGISNISKSNAKRIAGGHLQAVRCRQMPLVGTQISAFAPDGQILHSHHCQKRIGLRGPEGPGVEQDPGEGECCMIDAVERDAEEVISSPFWWTTTTSTPRTISPWSVHSFEIL